MEKSPSFGDDTSNSTNDDHIDVAPEKLMTRSISKDQLPRFGSRRDSTGHSKHDDATHKGSKSAHANHSSAETLMENGIHAMNETLATLVEDALGSPIPSVELRFRDVRLATRVRVSNSGKTELPTLWNQFRNSLGAIGAKSEFMDKEILASVSGVFKPERMTLILGQPGSGKSALMKVLAGRFPMDKSIEYSGEIYYNTMSRDSILPQLPRIASYTTQRDKHYPRMTVTETFEFAHSCMSGKGLDPWAIEALKNCTPEQHDAALRLLEAHHKHAADIKIKMLGLENCKGTIVGDDMLRGISGGERKRVTTGEMSFGAIKVHLMDEISTGLDSAAAYDIVKALKSMAVNFKSTVVISLLQPSPELFELFDDVMILNEGHIMFHGERAQALPYFEEMGFICPPRRDAADFLLDLGTNKQHQYVAPNAAGNVPFLASDFAERFQRSDIFKKTVAYLDTPLKETSTLLESQSPFRNTFMEDLQLLLKRQLLLTVRNVEFLSGRAIMTIAMGILYGTTFWNMDDANGQLILGLLFSATLFLSMGTASQVPTHIEARPVFYKQRGANFFRSSAYVLANSVVQVPFAVIETVLFGSFVYWMGGYVSVVDRFIVFLVTNFLCQMFFTGYFFFIASSSPNLTIATSMMIVCILFFMLFAGFLMSKDDIPDYFIWVYWINPLAWAIRSLSVNQYLAPQFDVCTYQGIEYCERYGVKSMGEYSLKLFGLPAETMWIYYGWIYFIVGYFIVVYLGYLALEYKRYEGPENTTIVANDSKSADQSSYVSGPSTPVISKSGGLLNKTVSGDVAVAVEGEIGYQNIIPVSLAFQDLWYSVPVPGSKSNEEIDLLKGVSGFALPGTMTALMGSSGAGKTTLMDVIAGRKTGGKIRGQILLNGYPATDTAVRRCTGYCEQQDIHSDSATIREALVFSALLRQDARVPIEDKLATVDQCIELLELEPIADHIIRGSSVEQMKRLTIGVELAANPSVLFMDEPTSGLDARSAKLIMSGVRKIADTGRTVVCTIHQPSTEVFNFFDSLLLLQRGGHMVYFGEVGKDSCKLIEYFQAAPDVKPIEQGYNPATWMLECIGAGVGNTGNLSVDFPQYFQESDLKVMMEEDLNQDGVLRPSAHLPELKFDRKRASSSMVQLRLLCNRFFRMYWRTPTYNLTRFFVTIMLATIFAIIYTGTDYATYSGASAGVGMIFTSTSFIGMIGFNSVMPIAAEERTAFYRERASQTYNALWYFVAGTLAEIPYVFFSAFLFTAIVFPAVGFEGTQTFFLYWIALGLNNLLFVYFGQLLVYGMPSVEVAHVIGTLCSSTFMLFAGFNPPANNIPAVYKWIYYISPPTYSIAILAAVVFADCPDESSDNLGCHALQNAPPTLGEITVKQYVEDVFEMKYDDIVRNVVIICMLIVGFRVIALYCLRYVNHLKR